MTTLSDCTTYYFRELLLRVIFFNEKPPWESGFYSWPPTAFTLALHKTADPGEAGSMTSNIADYTDYANISYGRGSAYWTLGNAGTANPSMGNALPLNWPANAGLLQAIVACSIGLRNGGTDVPIGRDVFGAAVDIDLNEIPTYAVAEFEVRCR